MADDAPHDRRPGGGTFSRLSLTARLALLSLVFVIPIFAVASSAYTSVQADLRAIDTEEQGARFNAAAVATLVHIH